jgi:hypothetical protein
LIGTVLGAFVLGADALVTTDEEQIRTFLEDVTEASPNQRVDAALDYADPDRQSVDLELDGGRASYHEGQTRELSADARAALAALDKDELKLVQDAIEVDDDRALVAIRAQVPGGEFIDVQFRLTRHDEAWLLSQVRVL